MLYVYILFLVQADLIVIYCNFVAINLRKSYLGGVITLFRQRSVYDATFVLPYDFLQAVKTTQLGYWICTLWSLDTSRSLVHSVQGSDEQISFSDLADPPVYIGKSNSCRKV